MAAGPGFWVTNRVANPVLRRLLRGPIGKRLGRSLMVLRYTGTVTGRPHELVVLYAREGDTVWVLVGAADRKTWWHNLRQPADVDLWVAGEHLRARASVVSGSTDPDAASVGLAAYRRAVPRAAADASGATLVRADITALG
jgi:hypothetical protein